MEKCELKNIKLFLFDMDGTLYLGDRLFGFTRELLATVRKNGADYLFMTNNSSRSVSSYVEKLKRLGIEAEEEDFITSTQATALYLLEKHPNSVLYVCGTASMKEELEKSGFEVTDDAERAECIVIGNDTELTFKKLDDISRLLSTREIPFVATNPDYVCPTEYGFVPDCGSFCDMIYNATKKRPVYIGKPYPLMPEMAMKKMGVTPSETAVVGDRIYTDIKSGLNAGCVTALVMSGETDEKTLRASPDKPDLVLESAKEILDILKNNL